MPLSTNSITEWNHVHGALSIRQSPLSYSLVNAPLAQRQHCPLDRSCFHLKPTMHLPSLHRDSPHLPLPPTQSISKSPLQDKARLSNSSEYLSIPPLTLLNPNQHVPPPHPNHPLPSSTPTPAPEPLRSSIRLPHTLKPPPDHTKTSKPTQSPPQTNPFPRPKIHRSPPCHSPPNHPSQRPRMQHLSHAVPHGRRARGGGQITLRAYFRTGLYSAVVERGGGFSAAVSDV
jgi:hypothetical protein